MIIVGRERCNRTVLTRAASWLGVALVWAIVALMGFQVDGSPLSEQPEAAPSTPCNLPVCDPEALESTPAEARLITFDVGEDLLSGSGHSAFWMHEPEGPERVINWGLFNHRDPDLKRGFAAPTTGWAPPVFAARATGSRALQNSNP